MVLCKSVHFQNRFLPHFHSWILLLWKKCAKDIRLDRGNFSLKFQNTSSDLFLGIWKHTMQQGCFFFQYYLQLWWPIDSNFLQICYFMHAGVHSVITMVFHYKTCVVILKLLYTFGTKKKKKNKKFKNNWQGLKKKKKKNF